MKAKFTKLMRYKFNEVFTENPDGTLSPIRKIMIGGVSFGPEVSFGPGAGFGGVNLYQYKGHDLEAEEQDEILIIKAIY